MSESVSTQAFAQGWSRSSAGRSRVLALAQSFPGSTLSELGARSGLSIGTVHYHVRRLEAAGLLRTRAFGRRRVVLADVAGGGAADELGLSLLKGPSCRLVALVLSGGSAWTIPLLVSRTGLSARAVYHHVKSLKEAGLVTSGSATRYVHLAPTPRLHAALARVVADEATGMGSG